ncbi:DUF3810 domain-containing protein [Chryseobacterium sp.]|uniref:DUF3810 domain-containing protein n=1 Tax=Chryseobacterium sp. TaxID=1871047 RepID=UPI00388EF7A6
MHINFKQLYHKKRFWAAILVVQFLLFYLFSKIGVAISFFSTFFKLQKKLHQLLFSWIPFSFGDLLYIVLILFLIYNSIGILNSKRRATSIFKIIIVLNIFYFCYQVFWGMLYFQEPLLNRLPKIEVTLEKRKNLALTYLEKCKNSRSKVHEDKNGVFAIKDWRAIQQEIIVQQKYIPKQFYNHGKESILSFKPSLFGHLMSFTGIAGYYNPFSAEAQYNENLPASSLPFTLAHESAHQIGFAREQEANFIGYLIGTSSKNNELRYSAEFFTLRSLLNSIVVEDEKFVKGVVKQYSEGMQKDRAYEKEFQLLHQGIIDEIFSFTNNIFLKSNQQEGSVTYSYFVNLLVKYEE